MLEASKWVDDYGDILLSYTMSRINNLADAEDLVQETLFSAYKNKDSFKGNSSEKTWLIAILKNKIIDYYRNSALSKKEISASDKIEDHFFDQKGHWVNSLNSFTADHENEIQQELLKIITACKDKLPENFRAVFTLKFYEDLPAKEICKILEISSSNYWVLIHRAKLVLKDCVDKNLKE